MSNVVTPLQRDEGMEPSPPGTHWRRYVPLVLAGVMALALWAFSGGQSAAPPPTTGTMASPTPGPEEAVASVTTTNTAPPREAALIRPSTAGVTAIGSAVLEPSGLIPVALSGGTEQLIADRDDVLWWRAEWGLARFDSSTTSGPAFYTAGDDLFFASVTAISPAMESGIWATGRDGTLRRFDGETFADVIATPEPLCQVTESPRLGVWGVGCGWEKSSTLRRATSDRWESGGWLYHWTGDTWQPDPEGRPHRGAAELTVDLEGRVWVANREVGRGVNSDGLSVFDGDVWTTFAAEHGLPSGVVQRITGAVPGELWVRTYSGPSVFDGTRWRSPSGDPESDQEQWRGLMSIVEHDGELVATRVFSSWRLVRVADGVVTEASLGPRAEVDLTQAGGRLWIADDSTLYQLDDMELSPVVEVSPRTSSRLPSEPEGWQITAVSNEEALILSNGRPWRCVRGSGCDSWPGEFSLIDLVVDFDGRLLGLAQEELLQLEDGAWTPLTPISAWEALHGP